jgi:hypothetical protein
MKQVVLGVLLGAGLVMAAVGLFDQRSEVFAQRLSPYQSTGADDQLIAVPARVGEQGQLLTLIDPRQQVMGVYHIDLATGKITLRSVRNFRWDLQMTYLNNEGPLPEEIRSLLEQR